MGTWENILDKMLKTFCILRIMVIRNGFDQAIKDDGLKVILKKNWQNVACRSQRVFQLRSATRPEREVLIEIV